MFSPVLIKYIEVKLIKNQDNFTFWVMKDPEMKKDYRGIDGTVGFVSAWESKMGFFGQDVLPVFRII